MLQIIPNAPLRRLNTFGIAVQARWLITYGCEDELCQALDHIDKYARDIPLLHIGGGSNLLFLNDYPGTILKSEIKGIRRVEETPDEVLVEVGAGEACDAFVAESICRGWYGMENLSLIPGQVGAAAVQNIGAYGTEVCDVIEEVRGIGLADGRIRTWKKHECRYGYRESIFKAELRGRYAITHILFRLSKHFSPQLQYGGLADAVRQTGATPDTLTAKQLRSIIITIRQAKLPDPAIQGNAGSFFKNPITTADKAAQLLCRYPDMPHYPAPNGQVKLAAGWLIEQAGWKGKSLGRAAVHDKQALVLVNKGDATGNDILRLCEAVRKDVETMFGVSLSPEVNFI